MKVSPYALFRSLIVALLSLHLTVTLALPSTTTGGQGGDAPLPRKLPLPKPPATPPTSPPATPTQPSQPPVASAVLPAGIYALGLRVQGHAFEAPVNLVRNGAGVTVFPSGAVEQLRGEVSPRRELVLHFTEPNGNRLTLRGPVVNDGVSGVASYTDGVATVSGQFDLYLEHPTAARKARQDCNATCQAAVIRSTVEVMNRLLKGIRLR